MSYTGTTKFILHSRKIYLKKACGSIEDADATSALM